MVTTVLLAVFVAVVLAAVVYRHFLPLLRNPDAPRGSFGWPLVGETIGFLRPHASNTTGDFLHSHITRYGAVFKSHLFGAPTVVSCDEELNHFVLQNEERLFQCSYPGPIRGILGGSSLLVVTGERHRRIRGMALAFAASTGLRPAYLADVDRAARAVVASWRGRCAAAFCDEAKQFAFGAIVEQVLGLSPEAPLIRRLLEHYSTFMKGLVSLPLNIPGTPYARAVEARRKISLTLEEIMDERWKGDDGSFRKSAFIDVLIANSELSHDDKVTFVLDSLLAGYETTSVLLSMLVYFVGQSPQCLEQLKVEHESIRSSQATDEFLTAEDYRKMEYTQRVINETLRCGNIVKFVHRKALKDVRYKGYVIPAGWKVLPILGSVHLDPALYKNPQEFDPCRWEGLDQTSSGKKFAPFGGGLRLCPGSELGKVEAAFFLHHLVLQYSWRLDGEDGPMAHPYVEFSKGLPIEIWCHQQSDAAPWFVGQL